MVFSLESWPGKRKCSVDKEQGRPEVQRGRAANIRLARENYRSAEQEQAVQGKPVWEGSMLTEAGCVLQKLRTAGKWRKI